MRFHKFINFKHQQGTCRSKLKRKHSIRDKSTMFQRFLLQDPSNTHLYLIYLIFPRPPMSFWTKICLKGCFVYSKSRGKLKISSNEFIKLVSFLILLSSSSKKFLICFSSNEFIEHFLLRSRYLAFQQCSNTTVRAMFTKYQC